MWIAALILTIVLIAFLMAAFFITVNLTRSQERIMYLLFAVLAGFAASFWGGSALFDLKAELSPEVKIGLSATAGIAVFFGCYFLAPHFLRIKPVSNETSEAADDGKPAFIDVDEAVDETRRVFRSPPRAAQKTAKELYNNCRRWSQTLFAVFDKAGTQWAKRGRAAAREVIAAQQRDLMKLDYFTVRAGSPALAQLGGDTRYREFVQACEDFYRDAVELKQAAMATYDHPGASEPTEAQISQTVESWKEEVDRMIKHVAAAYQKTVYG